MAYDEGLRTISLDADSSVALYTGVPDQPGSASPNSGFQYRFVKVTGSHLVGLCTAATDPFCGVLQNKPQNTGDPCTVAIGGVTRITAGAAVTAGQLVAPDGSGRAVHDDTNGKCVAIMAAGAAGDIIPILRIK